MRLIVPIAVLVLILFSGCGQIDDALLKKFTPPEDEAKATNYISLLRHGEFEQIQNDMDPSIKSADTHDTLVKMAAAIPPGEPISVKVIGAQQFRSHGTYTINLSFEYQFPTNWLIINVAVQHKDGVSTICGFHVQPISDSLEHYNRFTLAGKNLLQYTILALAILIPAFILYVLVVCIRTKMKKRKWLWIIFILIGVDAIKVNWTTGEWTISFFQIQLLGASAFAPPYGAWLIAVSVPLGAILFLLWRKQLSAP